MAWILLAVVFAALWVYAIYREDHRNPEPLWMLLLALLAGALAVPGADRMEGWLAPDLTAMTGSLFERGRIAFLVAGPVEEGLKLLAVLLLVRSWSHFDEAIDGIVYGAAAGAGFALVENLAFMQGQPEVILARGPIGTGAHVMFSTLWGGALGHAGHLKTRRSRWVVIALGLCLASLAHGAFDLLTFSAGRELSADQVRLAQVALMVACALFLRWRLRVTRSLPPFRPRRKSP